MLYVIILLCQLVFTSPLLGGEGSPACCHTRGISYWDFTPTEHVPASLNKSRKPPTSTPATPANSSRATWWEDSVTPSALGTS